MGQHSALFWRKWLGLSLWGRARTTILQSTRRCACMTQYRLFCLDDDMHIRHHQEYEAESDAAAIAVAASDFHELNREIWQSQRKVAVVPPSCKKEP